MDILAMLLGIIGVVGIGVVAILYQREVVFLRDKLVETEEKLNLKDFTPKKLTLEKDDLIVLSTKAILSDNVLRRFQEDWKKAVEKGIVVLQGGLELTIVKREDAKKAEIMGGGKVENL